MSKAQQAIRGKVARVLNAREVAINLGSHDGVILGMKFDVLNANGEDIRDPDTGELLGSLSRPKVRLQVCQVDDRLSVARTFKKRRINVGGLGSGFMADSIANYLLPPKWIDEYETLATEEKPWDDLDESESYVKTGDRVVEVLASEAEDRNSFPVRVVKQLSTPEG